MWSINRLWEVKDNPPPIEVDAIVGLSLSPAKDGTCGPTLKPVIRMAASFVLTGRAPFLILSNRYVVAGKNLATEEKLEAIRQGVPAEKIILPADPWLPEIRNTFEEARFAVRTALSLKKDGIPFSLLLVANHIHMRRVLAAFRILSRKRIHLYWISVHDKNAYTKDVYQARFRHESWFLFYEIVALTYSKLKGWA